MTNYVALTPARRSLLRRVPWRLLAGLATVAAATSWWWTAQPRAGVVEAIPVACCYGLLMCGALGQPWTGGQR